jgi:hypothetical protein
MPAWGVLGLYPKGYRYSLIYSVVLLIYSVVFRKRWNDYAVSTTLRSSVSALVTSVENIRSRLVVQCHGACR